MKQIILSVIIAFLITNLGFSQKVNSMAPAFKGQTIDGQTIELTDYLGKVVLLDFWASWCVPCLKEMPFLVEFYEANKASDFIIIAVNIDDKASNMNRFLSKINSLVPFAIIHDFKKTIPPKYDLQSMPTTIFIDKKGVIRYRHTGFKESHKKEFYRELKTLLGEKVESTDF